MHLIPCAFVFAFARAGKSIPARIAMIAITTSSSIKVKPRARGEENPRLGSLGTLMGFIQSRRGQVVHEQRNQITFSFGSFSSGNPRDHFWSRAFRRSRSAARTIPDH